MEDKILNRIRMAELLTKEVLGELSESEKEVLGGWKSDNKNKEIYKDIFMQERYDERNRMVANINLDKEWHNYLEQMGASYSKNEAKTRSLIIRLSIAAAAVLVLGVALFLNLELAGDAKLKTVEESNILPGKPQAELVLASGDVVKLNGASDNTIEDAGVKIESNEGKIAYDESISASESTEKPEIASNTLRIPKGGEYQVVLSDGTKVWLNSDSELSYPVHFNKEVRNVSLTGEAYFEVASDIKRPFYVNTSTMRVRVLGTSFNVNSYEATDYTSTTLVEGSVEVAFAGTDGNYKNVEYLSPNEQFRYNVQTHIHQVNKVDPYYYISWKDGRMVFRNEPLGSFMEKVSRWYNIEVVFEDKELKDIRFSGDLKRYNDLTDFLQILEKEMTVKVRVKDNHIIYLSK